MRTHRKQYSGKLTALILVPIIALAILGMSYSHWQETLTITGTVTTGKWKACIRIQKTLEGAFTNPETGEDLTTPTDLIAIASTTFPTKFKLTIYIENCESTTLTNVVVTDMLPNEFGPINWTASKGTVSWHHIPPQGGGHWDGTHFARNYLIWDIGNLNPEESASLVIWIKTLMNPTDKYAPTSDNENYTINKGAKVVADSPLKTLSTTTGNVTISIRPYDPEEKIGIISTSLPYSTPWAEDRYP